MALSLQQEQQSQDLQWEQLPEGISDLELAKKLQEEEDRRASQYYQEQEQEQAAAAAAQVGRERQEWWKDWNPASTCLVCFFLKECIVLVLHWHVFLSLALCTGRYVALICWYSSTKNKQDSTGRCYTAYRHTKVILSIYSVVENEESESDCNHLAREKIFWS